MSSKTASLQPSPARTLIPRRFRQKNLFSSETLDTKLVAIDLYELCAARPYRVPTASGFMDS